MRMKIFHINMKSFICKIGDHGQIAFIDKNDKASFERLLSSIKTSGKNKFKITISLLEDDSKITEKQKRLFKVLVSMISDHTGSDYNSVYDTLIQDQLPGGKRSLDELSRVQYSNFLEKCCAFSNSFFDLNVQFNSETNEIEIKRI